MATDGKYLMKSVIHIPNQPKAPTVIPISIHEKLYPPHAAGMNSRVSDWKMMLKRSSHIPMLMKIERMNRNAMFVRKDLIHNNCGKIQLQKVIPQNAIQYSPNGRNQNWKRSKVLLLNHAV